MTRYRTLVSIAVLLAVAGCHGTERNTAAVDTTLPDENSAANLATAAADTGNDLSNAGASEATARVASFAMPSLPTDVEQTQCHMGECTWEQVVAVTDVASKGNEVLRQVASRSTSTETPDGGDYPKELPPGPHDWTRSTSYFICSLDRPTAMYRGPGEKDFTVTPLHVVSPFGYETSSVADYKRACHGIAAGSEADQHPEKIGYIDRQDGPDQSSVKQPMDAF